MKKVVADIETKVSSIMKDFKRNKKVKCRSEKKILDVGFMAHFDPEKMTIFYDPMNMYETYSHDEFKKKVGAVSIRNFVKALIAHEIGHSIDFEENPHLFYSDIKDTGLQLELNAWKKGREFIDPEQDHIYNLLEEISLDHYKRDGLI